MVKVQSYGIISKVAILLSVVCACSVEAQSGPADPDAIDFSDKLPLLAKSTDIQRPINYVFNVGRLDEDEFAELSIGSMIRLGGPFLFDQSKSFNHERRASAHLDFNQDGLEDLVTNSGGIGGFFYHQNQKRTPPINFQASTKLSIGSYLPAERLIGAIDYDLDGNSDILGILGPYLSSRLPNYFVAYKYDSKADTITVFPTDSLVYPPGNGYFLLNQTIGKLAGDGKPSIVVSQSDTMQDGGHIFKIGIVLHAWPLHDAEIRWISRSDEGGPLAKNLYCYDITNDGVDDLLVADGDSLFIYKGGEGFGLTQLTRQNAYYTIRSPKWEGNTEWPGINGFGGTIRACGDLTGSGIPYVMLTASTGWPDEEAGFAFFYAGGNALDSKYDAVVRKVEGSIEDGDSITVDRSSATAMVLLHWKVGEQLTYLLHDGTDKIPHKINPLMASKRYSESNESISVTLEAGLIKLKINSAKASPANIQLFDVMGRLCQSRAIVLSKGMTETQIELADPINGAYLIKIETSETVDTKKLILTN